MTVLHSKICWYTSEVRSEKSLAVFVSDVALCCVNILIVVLNMSANGFVVYRYSRTRSRQPVSNTLLFLLASFDLLQGLISQPVFIASVMLKLHNVFECRLHDASKTIFVVFAGFGFIMTAVVLTSERLLAVVFPIWHRVHLRKAHVVGLSLGVFVFWASFMVISLHVAYNKTFFRVLIACTIGLSLVYALAGYTKIYFVCRRCKKRQRTVGNWKQKGNLAVNPGSKLGYAFGNIGGSSQLDYVSESGAECNERTASRNASAVQNVPVSRRERKTVIRMVCILGALFLSHLPALILFSYVSYHDVGYLTMSYFSPWTRTAVFLSTVINPVLYCYRNEHFRARKSLRMRQRTTGASNRAFPPSLSVH